MNEKIEKGLEKNCLSYNEKSSYIKKIVCEILKYDENHMFNQLIGELYDNYLRKNYFEIVMEEFYLSPIAENRINNMSIDKQISLAKETLDTYIRPIAYNVYNNDYIIATSLFYSMNQFIRRKINFNNELMTDKMLFDEKEAYLKRRMR